jgi:multidrug efflux system outer membrane protein
MKTSFKYGLLMILLGCIFLPLKSCKVGEDYERQEMKGPEVFSQDFPKDSSISNLPWWKLFNDSILVDLIDTALVNNKNIQIAISRIEEAQLEIDIAKADYYPLIGYNAYGASLANSEVSGLSNQVGGGVNVSYTVDLWQKIKSMNKIALQNYFATEDAYRSLNISIVSTVAGAYVSLRDIDNRIIIAEKTTKNFQENLDVMQARFNGGFISEVDLYQSKIQVRTTKISLEIFKRSRVQIENAISVLLGTAPRSIPRGLPLYDQISAPEIPVGLPSELLDRRPDIVQAERRLHAQTLRIGVAEALKYPSLTLSLDMGAQLVNPSFLFADLGAQLLGPIFNAGKLKRNVEVEEARTRQLLLDYESSYLLALQEVEDAMIAVQTYRIEYKLRNEQMLMATKAAELAWVRYDGGLTSYLEVLSLQGSQFDTELRASEAFKNQITSIVSLYEALGGGWYEAPENMNELN